jgi:hypothetical protein
MVRLILLCLMLASAALAEDRDTLHLSLVLDPMTEAPFERQMVLATLRGVYREKITHEEVKMRPMTDFDWMRLGQDTWTNEQIDGRPALVMERRIALFPRGAGTLTIPPVAHELQILGPGGARETVIIRSAPVTLTARPKPEGAGETWLPAEAVEISESWSADPAALKDGDSVERKVILRALGVAPERLPEQPPMREPWLITFAPPEERSVQITPAGPVSTVIWRWTLRPITGEPGVIREVTLPWFDTGSGEAKIATIPAAPFGYASFRASEGAHWRTGLDFGTPALALFVLSAIAGLMAAPLWRYSATGLWRSARAHHADWRTGRSLRRSAADGDLKAFRSHAAAYLKSRGIGDERVADLLAPVDRCLFGGQASGPQSELIGVLDDIGAAVQPLRNRAG